MSEKLEMLLEVLDDVACSRPREFYYQMVFSLTTDEQHAAMYISSTDFTKLKKFVEDVDQLRKEK